MSEEKKKKKWLVVASRILRYGVAIALGYLTGDTAIINTILTI